MLPVGPDCSDIRPGLGPWFGRCSAGFLVLDGCFISVAASVSSMNDIVVDSTFVVVVVSLVSSELQ